MVRFKNRYLVTEYAFTRGKSILVSKQLMLKLLTEQVQILHGDFGAAAVQFGFDIKYLNYSTNIAVFRARHGPHKLVASAVPTIQSPVVFKLLRLTATILKAFRFIRVCLVCFAGFLIIWFVGLSAAELGEVLG